VTAPDGASPEGQAFPAAAYPVFVAFSDSPGAKGPGGGGGVDVVGGGGGGGVLVVGVGVTVTVDVTVCVVVTVVVGPGTVGGVTSTVAWIVHEIVPSALGVWLQELDAESVAAYDRPPIVARTATPPTTMSARFNWTSY